METQLNDYFAGLRLLARTQPGFIRKLSPKEIALCWQAFQEKEAWAMKAFAR